VTPPESTDLGRDAHHAALERLYAVAPINSLFPSRLSVTGEGRARIDFELGPEHFHAGGAVHGTAYFKMLDDAAFYAANSLVTDHFLLTTAFNLFFTRPMSAGPVVAHGRWLSGRRRILVAEGRLEQGGEEVGRGTGTFMISRIPLSDLPGYAAP